MLTSEVFDRWDWSEWSVLLDLDDIIIDCCQRLSYTSDYSLDFIDALLVSLFAELFDLCIHLLLIGLEDIMFNYLMPRCFWDYHDILYEKE